MWNARAMSLTWFMHSGERSEKDGAEFWDGRMLQTSGKGLHFGMLHYVQGYREWETKGHDILGA